MNNPVSFSRWAEALTSDLEVGPGRKDACRRAILSYLKYLKDRRQRASFASAIRTVQELLGHADVETTMIYTHVMNKPGVTVHSPLDQLG